MLRGDEVRKNSNIFSNPSIQPGHECFVIIGAVGKFLLWSASTFIYMLYVICYMLYLYVICQQSKSPCIIALYSGGYLAVGQGKVLFRIIVEPRMFGVGIVQKRSLSFIQPSLFDTFPNKTVRDGMLGLGMVPKEILSRLLTHLI